METTRLFKIVSIINLPWGQVRSNTKFGLDRFSRFDVYCIQTNGHPDKQSIHIDIYYFAVTQYSRNYSDLNETESTLASTPTTIVQSTITLESTQTTASIRTTPSRSTTGRTTTSRTTTRRTTTGRSSTRSTTTSQTTTRRTTTGRTTTSRTTTRRTTSTTSETTSTKRTTRTTRSTTERPQSSDVPNLKHIASLLGNQGIFGVDGPINSLDSPINRLDRPINRLDIPINRLNMESFYPTNDEINSNLFELKNDHGTPHNGPVIVSESYTIICTQKGWVEKTGNQVALIDIYDLKLKCLGNK